MRLIAVAIIELKSKPECVTTVAGVFDVVVQKVVATVLSVGVVGGNVGGVYLVVNTGSVVVVVLLVVVNLVVVNLVVVVVVVLLVVGGVVVKYRVVVVVGSGLLVVVVVVIGLLVVVVRTVDAFKHIYCLPIS